MFNRGAVIAAVIDELRKHYFVKVVVHMGGISYGSEYKWKDIDIRVCLDTSNLYSRSFFAFVCANEAMLRRISFAVVEEMQNKKNIPGYGMPFGLHDMTDIPKSAVLFEKMDSNSDWDTIDKAKDMLRKVLSEHNITIGEAA